MTLLLCLYKLWKLKNIINIFNVNYYLKGISSFKFSSNNFTYTNFIFQAYLGDL